MNVNINLWLQDFIENFLKERVERKVRKERNIPFSVTSPEKLSFEVTADPRYGITVDWIHRDKWGYELDEGQESFSIREALRLIVAPTVEGDDDWQEEE